MRLTGLTLADVRNYSALEFEPVPGVNVLAGPNAQGKSNLLEAIGLLGTGKSFRTSRESELIAWGMPLASVSGTAALAAGTVRLACTLAASAAGTRKIYTVNGGRVGYSHYLGRLRVVTFVPAHLQLVGGPPALRRSLLNAALSQESPAYYAALANYAKHLAQKNALLRGGVSPDEDLLATYDERLVASGTAIVLARRAFIASLDERASPVYRRWAGGADGELHLGYAANVPCDVPTADAVAAAFTQRLADARFAEAQRKTSLVGPHRDDLEFRLGERALAAFGSQGQQRTAVLALKVAEHATLEAYAGEAPLLLLDDVLSELDAERRRAFLEGVAGVEQAFITSTGAVDTPVAATFSVRAARVERVA
ncbi:MAG: DNA replication and repair protein RecF [Candidatus Eremiobacteraeota bacterium]|nr:DNA replication and repair protein RecF [Candidatus Eremiobacteraeota bacterium]